VNHRDDAERVAIIGGFTRFENAENPPAIARDCVASNARVSGTRQEVHSPGLGKKFTRLALSTSILRSRIADGDP